MDNPCMDAFLAPPPLKQQPDEENVQAWADRILARDRRIKKTELCHDTLEDAKQWADTIRTHDLAKQGPMSQDNLDRIRDARDRVSIVRDFFFSEWLRAKDAHDSVAELLHKAYSGHPERMMHPCKGQGDEKGIKKKRKLGA